MVGGGIRNGGDHGMALRSGKRKRFDGLVGGVEVDCGLRGPDARVGGVGAGSLWWRGMGA